MTPKLYPIAAMSQSAQLVLQLATLGNCDEKALKVQIESLYALEPHSLHAIYGDIQHLDLGLAYFDILCRKPFAPAQKVALRLIYSFLSLAKRIIASPRVAETLKTQLQRTQEQANYFGIWNHPRVIQNLGDTYLELAHHFRLRLQLTGQKKYLQDLENLHKIRAALLSGVRAAVLWYQMKGNMLETFWQRNALRQEARELLKGNNPS